MACGHSGNAAVGGQRDHSDGRETLTAERPPSWTFSHTTSGTEDTECLLVGRDFIVWVSGEGNSTFPASMMNKFYYDATAGQ